MFKKPCTDHELGGAGFGKTHPDSQERINAIQPLAGSPGKTSPPAARQARFERALKAA